VRLGEEYDAEMEAAVERVCTEAEKKAGIGIVWDMDEEDNEIITFNSLQATSFEEFLFRLYLVKWTDYLVNEKSINFDQIPPRIKECLICLYSKEGRHTPQ
jgi:hypothetical protein